MKRYTIGLLAFFICSLLMGGFGWTESQAAPPAGTSPVYRFCNTTTGTYFYTISEAEKNNIIQNYPHFRYEGIAWYAYPPGPSPSPGGSAQWGVLNNLACKSGAALTFRVTIDGVSRKSITYGSGPDATFEGWVDTTTGVKTYTYSLQGCGASHTGTDTTSFAFEANRQYLFYTDLKNGDPVIVITEVNASASEEGKSSARILEEFTIDWPFPELMPIQ